MTQLKEIFPIMDKRMRGTLIRVATFIETKWKEGAITPSTPILTKTMMGLTISVEVTEKSPTKPLLMKFTYTLDRTLFSNWLRTIPHLLEGPLSFVKNGIEVVIPYGLEKWDESAFSIDGHQGRIWLPLMTTSVSFVVHRDLFQGVEWVIVMEDPEE